MKRFYLPFLAFAALFILTIPLSFDMATSVVPGWHTAIFPPFFIINLLISAALALAGVGYWKLVKRSYKAKWKVFMIHLMLTIPAIVQVGFPLLWNFWLPDQNELIEWVTWETNLKKTACVLFVAGQVLFLIYYFKTKRLSPHRT